MTIHCNNKFSPEYKPSVFKPLIANFHTIPKGTLRVHASAHKQQDVWNSENVYVTNNRTNEIAAFDAI